MQWSLDQLRQFVMTVDRGSISAAARQLDKAQSAVSTAIALLEADLGVALFDRSGHKAQLTEAGALLLREARELLRQADELEQRAQALATGCDARLRLALDEALPYDAISTLMRDLALRFPDLELMLCSGTATEVEQRVAQHQADLGIHFDRGPLSLCYEERHLGGVAQGVYVAHGHPLQACQPVRRKDLVRHRQLVLHAEGIQERAYSPRIWRADSFYSIAEMVANDVGWAILPVTVAACTSYAKPLQQLDCPVLALPFLSVRMLWCQGSELNTAAQWIAQRFAQLLQTA